MITAEEYTQLIANQKGRPQKAQKAPVRAKAQQVEPKYKSKMERDYAALLDARKRHGIIAAWRYEAVGFRLANNTFYYPDFMVILSDGIIEFHETKGFDRQGKGKAKWKIAAGMYPEFVWKFITLEKGQWKVMKYEN
jgi:hypothetical protein